MKFSRQEYWSGLPFPFSRDLPDPGVEPESSGSAALALHTWEALPSPSPWQTLIYFLSVWVYLFWTFCISGVTRYKDCCV